MNIHVQGSRTGTFNNIWRPEFLRLQHASDRQRFNELLGSATLFLHDEIRSQLRELIKTRHPAAAFTKAEMEGLIIRHAGEENLDSYGVWVYYPWSARMVHLLDEAEFAEVRTSRNRYKITQEEQEILSVKKAGVIGLSVGQSVAITMAMERSFGEIRLADFDVLELTNLNRIRTDVFNLGLKKVISVAREIAGIDPFLKVSIFPEGLTDENMDAFFTGGGKLDVVIDECDGVDMKIKCRQKAKELGIPVLMEASDRCTIDVERFDLEPSRPLLHGYIDHLDLSRLPYLKTNEEKIPYLAPMVGIDTMSVRLKASALEVGHSISTWPQLASAVVLGGGALGDIWRRIALDQFRESGRYFVDLEELAGNKAAPAGDKQGGDSPGACYEVPFQRLTTEEMAASAGRYLNGGGKAASARGSSSLASPEGIVLPHPGDTASVPPEGSICIPPEGIVRDLVAAAGMAPSGGNSQPWRWVFSSGKLFLFLDRHEAYSYMNFRDSASCIALGAAVENLVLRARRHGLGITGDYFPAGEQDSLVAVFGFHHVDAPGTEPVKDPALADFIEKRHTNRKFPERVVLAGELLEALKSAGESIPGVKLTYIDNLTDILEVGKIIGITDRYRILDPKSNYDFIHREMRWTEEEAEDRRTGMEAATLELRESELIGLKFIRDAEVISFISKIGGGHLLKNASVKNAAAASVFGLLTIPSFSNPGFFGGGRASQRLWLKATQLGLAFHPMNVPLAYFMRLKHDSSDLPAGTYEEIKSLYDRFTRIFGHSPQREEIYLFRLFKAGEPARKPYRKLIDEILTCI